MNIEIDDIEKRYAHMSEEELAAVRPNELTEVARQCYEREVGRRQGVPPSAAHYAIPSETSLKERGEGPVLKAARHVANLFSVFFAFCSVLVFLERGGRLVSLVSIILANVFLFYLFRVPYYIIKGYTGKTGK